MSYQTKDHTVTITVAVLVGIVLTLTIGILALVYTHESDVNRDKYYAEHCQTVTLEKQATGLAYVDKFKCGDK